MTITHNGQQNQTRLGQDSTISFAVGALVLVEMNYDHDENFENLIEIWESCSGRH